jgi:Domain of unknown function (DUF1963)
MMAGLSATAGYLASAGSAFAQRKGGGPMEQKRPGNRVEPLFLSEADARQVMRDYCRRGVDHPMTAKQVDFLLSRLTPQIWTADRRDGVGGPGETRLGGAPDLSRGSAWPIRPVPADADKKAQQWKEHHGWAARQITQKVPFEFIAQIDLIEAARHSVHSQGLPTSGRLLFFWDGAAGILESGAHTCLVIHDETPVAHLARLPIPDKFAEMEAWWRDANLGTTFDQEGTIRMLEAAGLTEAAQIIKDMPKPGQQPDPNLKKPFVYPARAMKLEPLWVLPRQNALELKQDKELTAFADGDETREHYSLLTGNDVGPFTSDRSNMRRTQNWLTLEARRTRLMGPAHPVQDDPRYSVLSETELPPYPWNSANIAEAARKAEAWQTLLQVSVADLAQLQTEGTVYFMIRKDDLAKRDFSQVVASYQQT